MRYPRDYNPTPPSSYEQVYGTHRSYPAQQHHGVHLGTQGLAQVHMRSGSNLSSGSSTQNNLNTSGGSGGSGKAPRPKSNFYEYEMYNPSVQQQHNHYHYQQQQQQQHHHHQMYSVPRGQNMYNQNN